MGALTAHSLAWLHSSLKQQNASSRTEIADCEFSSLDRPMPTLVLCSGEETPEVTFCCLKVRGGSASARIKSLKDYFEANPLAVQYTAAHIQPVNLLVHHLSAITKGDRGC